MAIARREQEQGPDRIRSVIWRIRRTQEYPQCVPARKTRTSQLIVSQNDAEHQSHLGKVQEGTDRHLETLGGERRQEDLSGRCVAEGHESDCPLRATKWEERDEDLDG